MPPSTWKREASPTPSNSAASVAVIHTWPRPSRRPNKAARRFGIEMRRNLVEQQDRRLATPLGDQLGMGEDEPEQQRLLLAGR